jgi:hypothetical protein
MKANGFKGRRYSARRIWQLRLGQARSPHRPESEDRRGGQILRIKDGEVHRRQGVQGGGEQREDEVIAPRQRGF